MKTFALLSVLAAGSLMAGEKAALEPMMPPPPEPSIWQWFVGGSVGYLDELDTEMYTLHAGVDFPNQLAGWDQAAYLEIGFATLDEVLYSGSNSGYLNNGKGMSSHIKYEADILPITINYKLERALTESLNMYLGGGIGVVNLDLSGGGMSDDDWTFYGQVFAGILYNVNETWEIYGGARWIYMDDSTLFGMDIDNQDDFMVEIGTRINL